MRLSDGMSQKKELEAEKHQEMATESMSGLEREQWWEMKQRGSRGWLPRGLWTMTKTRFCSVSE